MAKSNIKHIKVKRQAPNKILIKTGERFGRLIVIEEATPRIRPDNNGVRRMVKCQCDCGNTTTVLLHRLRSGLTKSCGCLSRETTSRRSKKHGLLKHPVYGLWAGMKKRCLNPNNHKFKDYGGRGIKVCDEWMKDFTVFFKWAIANHWREGLFIDRKDVNGNYCPVNCRFVDAGLSSRNARLLRSNNTSGYRGVNWKYNKWVSRICCRGACFNLGRFDTPLEAAHAYDAKARELNAGYPLNFPNKEI